MRKLRKALFCCGSRPEFIKISPVYHQLKNTAGIKPLLCDTGQHRDLSSPHMDHCRITPDARLDVMREGQGLDQLMARLCEQLPRIFDQFRPHIVLIQGDTASALASAITAQKHNCPIAHIEAGLRTYDRNSPFPEEIYRQNISRLAEWHFCPTEKARRNLLQEGVAPARVFVTGNTSVDMVINTYLQSVTDNKQKPFFLITLHRRESQGSPLVNIINSLLIFARSQPGFDFIIPLHPNPATSDMIRSLLWGQENIRLISPLPYPEFVQLMANAYAIITDSGGIQEEAPSLNTPVIVVRDKTERPEGVEGGCLRLAGTGRDAILTELDLIVNDKSHYKKMQLAENPFGDGRAAERITQHLVNILEREAPHHAHAE